MKRGLIILIAALVICSVSLGMSVFGLARVSADELVDEVVIEEDSNFTVEDIVNGVMDKLPDIYKDKAKMTAELIASIVAPLVSAISAITVFIKMFGQFKTVKKDVAVSGEDVKQMMLDMQSQLSSIIQENKELKTQIKKNTTALGKYTKEV